MVIRGIVGKWKQLFRVYRTSGASCFHERLGLQVQAMQPEEDELQSPVETCCVSTPVLFKHAGA